MLLYITAFTIAAVMPTFFGYTGWLYFSAALCIGLIWLYYAIKGFFTSEDQAWARKIFFLSILVIVLLCIMMVSASATPSSQIHNLV
ncbi:MAG: hypothetical protein GY821_09765 [Gammaproteobacteria bacterium]|nr:hypothetical protein [Gammaproteobacteria bacterium]